MNETSEAPHFDDKLPVDWLNSLFVIGTLLTALVVMPIYLFHNGVRLPELTLFFVLYWCSGIGITMGYHRLFAHKTYEAHPVIKFFLLVFGSLAFENSAYKWASDHRFHHRHVDTDLDPYNAKRGFWYSHMGWILHKEPGSRNFDNVTDLAKDPLVMWQHRYAKVLAVLVGWGMPLLVGYFVGRPWGFFLWGGLLRTVFVHHGTFLINSMAHYWGKQTYDDRTTAKDSWWLALFTFGEGYHNFHHRFQSDYRNGVRWFHWDPSKWLIRLCSHLGLTKNLRRSPDLLILSKRWEMDVKRLEVQLASRNFTGETWTKISQELDSARAALEERLKEWKGSLAQYAQEKRELSGQAAQEWRRQIQAQKALFQEALQRWEYSLQYYYQMPVPVPVATK